MLHLKLKLTMDLLTRTNGYVYPKTGTLIRKKGVRETMLSTTAGVSIKSHFTPESLMKFIEPIFLYNLRTPISWWVSYWQKLYVFV